MNILIIYTNQMSLVQRNNVTKIEDDGTNYKVTAGGNTETISKDGAFLAFKVT